MSIGSLVFSGGHLFFHAPEDAGVDRVTTRVSVGSNGEQGEQAEAVAYTVVKAISADGQFVSFTSTSDNLVPGDANSIGDVFVYDRLMGTTTRVSSVG